MARKVILPVIFLLFVSYIVYSTLNMGIVSCTVCMEVNGKTACRTASGETREIALRTATENACAQLVSGMAATRLCTQAEPKSIEWEE